MSIGIGISIGSVAVGGSAPVPESASVPSAGTTLSVTMSGELSASFIPALTVWTISGTLALPISTDIDGDTLTLTCVPHILQGQTITLSFVAGITPLVGANGRVVADFSDFPVTNGSTQLI